MTNIQQEPGLVQDITELEESSSAADGREPATSLDLYLRWERQQWAVADLEIHRDVELWNQLEHYTQERILYSLAELERGEESVTRTLGSLLDDPPTEDDRIFLCTQLADEARHVRFFDSYLQQVCSTAQLEQKVGEALAGADYLQVFEPALVQATSAARDGSRQDWHRALVFYHLMGEGVLAAAALRATRQLVKRVRLGALSVGLTNVIRDESRHVGFGIHAARAGVQDGYQETIVDAHCDAVDIAAWVLVGPGRHIPAPKLKIALAGQARQIQDTLDAGEVRLVRQLRLIGLEASAEKILLRWKSGVAKAINAYAERWGERHPIDAYKEVSH